MRASLHWGVKISFRIHHCWAKQPKLLSPEDCTCIMECQNTNQKCTVQMGDLKPSGFSLFGERQPETMDQNKQLFIGFIIDVRIKQNDT